jgi:hypothetical protein
MHFAAHDFRQSDEQHVPARLSKSVWIVSIYRNIRVDCKNFLGDWILHNRNRMRIVRWGQNSKHFLLHSLIVLNIWRGRHEKSQSFYAALFGSKTNSHYFLAAAIYCYTILPSNL